MAFLIPHSSPLCPSNDCYVHTIVHVRTQTHACNLFSSNLDYCPHPTMFADPLKKGAWANRSMKVLICTDAARLYMSSSTSDAGMIILFLCITWAPQLKVSSAGWCKMVDIRSADALAHVCEPLVHQHPFPRISFLLLHPGMLIPDKNKYAYS